jgi:hypothetical protein
VVCRYNKRTGRYEPDWETQWTRVRTDLTWATHHTPEDPAMQLYGAWKYTRWGEVEGGKGASLVG